MSPERDGEGEGMEKAEKGIRLSIVVPCYKAEKTLGACMDSLMGQTLDGIEVICVNDGSPDGSRQVMEAYRKQYGDRIVIIDKENEGAWKARKDGIAKAKGEYIGFVDSDDTVKEDFAEKLYATAKGQDADIAVCGFDRIDRETGRAYSREMCRPRYSEFVVRENPGLLLEINTAPWNKIYRAGVLKDLPELGHIPVALEDMTLLQLAYLRAGKIAFVPESLVRYMVHAGSLISRTAPEDLAPTRLAMTEVRAMYEAREEENYLDYTDANAFLHLGVSMMYRLSENRDVDFDRQFRENRQFLNEHFPRWRHSPYLTLGYSMKNRGANLKLRIVKGFYGLRRFKFFLWGYKLMIRKLGVDIKW